MSDFENIDKNTSLKDLTKEIWKRILNNLPFLYKSKGTEKSLRALITCYGIPSSILEIREFGGPDISDTENTSEYVFDNFSYALDFNGSQHISFPWTSSNSSYPSTVEIRFNTSTTSYPSMSLLTVVSGSSNIPTWGIDVVHTSGTSGKIRFRILSGSLSDYMFTSSSELPLYDGKFNTVAVKRSSTSDLAVDQTYTLYVKKSLYNDVFYYSTTELDVMAADNIAWSTSGSSIYIGGAGETGYSQKLYGSVDELRFWNQILDENTIISHTKHPKSIIGNDITGSFNDLTLRLPFDNPKNLGNSTSGSILNMSPSEAYPTSSMQIFGFSSEPVFPYSFSGNSYDSIIHFTNIGTTRWTNNKIRIESSSLSSNLDPDRRVEVSQYDYAALDSNKLGVYFSPTNPVDLNIIESLGLTNIGDLVGYPSELYENNYNVLKELNRLYWDLSDRKITIHDYLTYIRRYDKSLFENIKQFLPARVKPILGLLYEPHLLERNKTKHYKPVKEDLTKNSLITSSLDVVGLNRLYTSSVDVNDTNEQTGTKLDNFARINLISSSDFITTDYLYTSSIGVDTYYEYDVTSEDYNAIINENINLYPPVTSSNFSYETIIQHADDIISSSNLQNDYIYTSSINLYSYDIVVQSNYTELESNAGFRRLISTGAPYYNTIYAQDVYSLPSDLNISSNRIETSTTSSVYKIGIPIINFEDNDNLISDSGSIPFGINVYQIYDYYAYGGRVTGSLGTFNGYSKYHYSRYANFSTAEKRLKYKGCLNTIDTTYDGLNPIEVWVSNPNTLITDPDGIYKLRVE